MTSRIQSRGRTARRDDVGKSHQEPESLLHLRSISHGRALQLCSPLEGIPMLAESPFAGFETPVGRLEDLPEQEVELVVCQLAHFSYTSRLLLTAIVVTNIASTMP